VIEESKEAENFTKNPFTSKNKNGRMMSKQLEQLNMSTQETSIDSMKLLNDDQNKELLKSFQSKLPLITMTLNPKNDKICIDVDPLESGLLFAVLLKKFSQMLENPRIDNLILTQIWGKIASLPLEKDKPHTFYLYAFCFQVITSKFVITPSFIHLPHRLVQHH
jgi:hypothetical protein